MLWTLIKVRFSAILNSLITRGGKKSKSVAGVILAAVLIIYLLAFLVFITGAAMVGMATVLTEENLWLYFGFAGFMSLALCLITGIFSVQSHIFNARDNELLLSMPIPHRDILASRIGVVILPDILFTFLINATALTVYLFYHSISLFGVLALLLSTLFVPMISFAISAVIGWIISVITAKLPKKNLVSTVLFLAFFIGYMYLCMNMSSIMREFMINSNSYAGSVSKIFPIYHMGVSIAQGKLISLLLWALCAILPFIVVCLLLAASFVKLVTTKRGEGRTKYVAGRERARGQMRSLVFKETKHFLGSMAYLLNSGMGIIFLVLISIMIIYKAETFVALNSILGGYMPMLLAAALCFMASTVLITAPSVSLEGKNIWLIRSMPVKTEKILYAKLIMHELFTAPFILITSVICCAVLRTGVLDTLILLLLPQAYTLVCAASGLLINLKLPKLDYISETQAVKQSMSVVVTMFGGMGVALALSVGGFLLSSFFSIQIYGVLCIAFLAAVAVLLVKLISTVGVRMFEKL